MPIITRGRQPRVALEDGQPKVYSAQDYFRMVGPLLPVTLCVPDTVAADFRAQGLPVSSPVEGEAMIDTGASDTCIDIDLALQLHLPIGGQITRRSVHQSTEHDIFPVRIVLGPNEEALIPDGAGLGLAKLGCIALIGRDILHSRVLVYDGPAGCYTLASGEAARRFSELHLHE